VHAAVQGAVRAKCVFNSCLASSSLFRGRENRTMLVRSMRSSLGGRPTYVVMRDE
jgi:hypothetical protein